ncbi:MAG: hypothetical protein U0M60_16790, partial [Clostridia bacterium]|nr:hypothetical protein [Clostridia bacterium]
AVDTAGHIPFVNFEKILPYTDLFLYDIKCFDNEKQLVSTGYIHIAFRLGSKEAVDSLTERLKKDGYNVVSGPRTTGDGYYESCIIGIEGNQIEITV